MRSLVMMVLVVGCGYEGGPDLDIDGITDDEDDCQASEADFVVDADGDQKSAAIDLCPHQSNAAAGDLDFDGIPDACDPFPAMLSAKDTRRCVTSFAVGHRNAAYLYAREERRFDLTPPLSSTQDDYVEAISAFPLPYRSATFEVLGTVSLFPIWSSSFSLIAQAGDARSSDIACGFDGTSTLFVRVNDQATAPVVLPAPVLDNAEFRLRATVQTGGTGNSVLCRLTVGGASISTVSNVTIPSAPIRYGFYAAAADLVIHSLVVDSLDAPVVF